MLKLVAPLQQQPDDLQEVLVPADRDAVLGHAAEARHHAIVERFVQLVHIANRPERHALAQRRHAGDRLRQRLDLQSVHRRHRVAVVHQMMREREARRTQSDHQHLVSGRGLRNRPREVQRIPARQQAVNLEAPRQLQNIFERARFHLRNVHRVLLLEHAGLHAVVADAVPGAGGHGIVDGDDGQRADRVAVLLHHVHLGNLLVERAAGQRDAEHGRFERAVFFLEAGRATVLALVVALDAVVRLIERGRQVHARIGQLEAFAMAPVVLRQRQFRDAIYLRESRPAPDAPYPACAEP